VPVQGPPTVDPAGLRAASQAPAFGEPARPPHDPADADLVRQVAARDRAALSALYERHGRAVLAQIVLVVGERSLAEEILQDTMLALWRGAGSFRGDSRVRSWLIAIARRQARDRMRRRRVDTVTADILSGWPSAEPGPEDRTLARAEAATVAEAIGELDARHREILGLVYGAGMSLADAADVLGIPLGTVKSRLAGARSALSKSLSKRGYTR
jgi:RNA polymerase sigma-70 factor (ECF subfamily)